MGQSYAAFSELEGKQLTNIEVGEETIIFTDLTGKRYKLYHEQDCCESVRVEDICGDLDDIIGKEILLAEEVTESSKDNEQDISQTWTFYKLATLHGSVTIRWYGTSNGYYSESVDFVELGEIS